MNDINKETIEALRKQLVDVDLQGVSARSALYRLVGFISGYVPENSGIGKDQQTTLLEKTLEILKLSQ